MKQAVCQENLTIEENSGPRLENRLSSRVPCILGKKIGVIFLANVSVGPRVTQKRGRIVGFVAINTVNEYVN